MIVFCNGAANLDDVDQKAESPGQDDGPGSPDGEGEPVVEQVGVHQVQQPGEALDGPRQECGLPSLCDGVPVNTVEGRRLQDGQNGHHQRDQAPRHQQILLTARPQEPLRGLEAELVGRHHPQAGLQGVDHSDNVPYHVT